MSESKADKVVREAREKRLAASRDRLKAKIDVTRTRECSRIVIDTPKDGHVIIFSDAHFWPDVRTPAQIACELLVAEIKPWCLINNGDAFDGARVSRYPRIGWDETPTVKQELEACIESLQRFTKAAPKSCKTIWALGNHDARFENLLANRVPEYQGVDGFKLKDKFPEWLPCWSIHFGNQLVVKHRWKGGQYASNNNTIASGRSFATGHDHMLWAKAFTDLNGTRWGIGTGTLTDIYGPQFTNYTEDSPVNWQSGFVVLTFKNGRMLPPELVHAMEDGSVFFRGEAVVKP